MKTKLMMMAFVLGLSGVSSNAFAVAADPIRCTSMEKLAQDHRTWSVGFEKYQADFAKMDKENKFFKATRGTERILQNIEKFSELSGVTVDENLMDESHMDLDNASLGDIPKAKASAALKEKMAKLQNAMSDAIFKAQAKTPDCNLGSVNSPTL